MSYKIEKVCESVHLGEGPHWDEETQSLYYVDIFESYVHKYTPSTNTHVKAHIDGGRISIIIPVVGQPGKFVITIGGSLALIEWNGSDKVQKVTKLAQIDDRPLNRLNDGKADPVGRIWTGSMQCEEDGKFFEKKGSFYSYEKGDKIRTHATDISISNGLAWNKENTKFYYIDSLSGTLDEFDYDVGTGTITNRKPIFTPKKHDIDGILDGQTIDTDGNLWVAVFSGSCIVKVDPRKPECLLEVIKMPAKQITSVAFGGKDYDDLYVTSARITMDGVKLDPSVNGAIYKITGLGVKGFPAIKANI